MKRSILLIWACCIGMGGVAQERPSISYSGVVSDENGQPLEYATLLFFQSDSLKAGTTSDEDGLFVQVLSAGNYRVAVQSLGFAPLQKEIQLSENTIDTLILHSTRYSLGEVVVKGSHIERKADRFVLFVPPQLSKDGAEVIAQAPGVWLSDDHISINGTSAAKVFIDNKEVKLQGEELVNYLRSISSDHIKKIEVVPVAGVEYDADSRGGVILITLRQRLENGINGTVKMSTSYSSSLHRYQPSTSFNARLGRWNLNGTASGNFTPHYKNRLEAYRTYTDVSREFDTHSSFDIDSDYGTLRMEAIFEIDSLRSIGGEWQYIQQKRVNKSNSETLTSYMEEVLQTTGAYHQREDYAIQSATVNYLHSLKRNGGVLKAIGAYARKSSEGRNRYQSSWKQGANSKDSLYRSYADITYDIATAEASLDKQLSAHKGIKAGTKYTYTSMNDYANYEGALGGNEWIALPEYNYRLKYNEYIAALYFSLHMELVNFSFAGGVRGEHTLTNDRTNQMKKRYWDLFPNLSLTYAFDRMKKSMLVGQYARSIERPAFYTLNPNRIQSSEYSYTIGNPDLQPTYIDRISLTYVYLYRYTLTVGVNLHHDLIREFAKTDTNNQEISYITYENHHRENHWFVALSLPFQPFRWLNVSGNWIGVYQKIKMTEQSGYKKHYLSFSKVDISLNLSAASTIEFQYNGTSRLYSGNSEVAPRHTIDVRFRQKVAANRWVFTVAVNNLFDKHNNYMSRLPGYSQYAHMEEATTGRNLRATATWNFNSGKSFKKKNIDRGADTEFNRLK